MRSLAEALKEVTDHRQARGKRYELGALLLLMCTGMLCGCRGPAALAEWAAQQEGVLLKAMGFPRGQAPSYGTLQRTARDLNVESFERVLQDWAEEVLKGQAPDGQLQGVALDGKHMRGSREGALPGVHLLAALAHDTGLTLAQTAVPATTNEPKASVPLLAGLTLTNRVITGDAAFMQREVCQLIIHHQGHYLIVLKDNQPDVRQTVQDWFEPFPPTR
jgi:hypothetical protein